MLSVFKMNHLPVSASVLFYMLQNSVDVTCINKAGHEKWKGNVKKNSYLLAG